MTMSTNSAQNRAIALSKKVAYSKNIDMFISKDSHLNPTI